MMTALLCHALVHGVLLAAPNGPRHAPLRPAFAAPDPRTASNVVFAEAFGSGLLYSLNYERLIDALNLGVRAGASYFTYAVSSYGRSGNLTIVSVPIVASYYLRHGRHNLQMGLGATLLYTGAASDSQGVEFETERSGLGLAASAVLGYRYLPRDRGFTFGVALTPLIRAGAFLPWGGASAGYVF